MKTLIPFLFVNLLFQNAVAFETGGTLKAVVNKDTVLLLDDSCSRNCGSHYQMQVTANGFHVIWFQKDIGAVANCDCGFSLSTTIINLAPGTYRADVYYNSLDYGMDSIYVGYIYFTIPEGDGSYYKVNPYQSDCFSIPQSIDPVTAKNSFFVSPNPVKSDITIVIGNINYSTCTLEIVNIYGITVLETNLSEKKKGLYVMNFRPGIYFISLKTPISTYISKFIKL
jgi:hypothetical protein